QPVRLEVLSESDEPRGGAAKNAPQIAGGVTVTNLARLWIFLKRHLIERFAVRPDGLGAPRRERRFERGQSFESRVRPREFVDLQRHRAGLGIAHRKQALLEIAFALRLSRASLGSQCELINFLAAEIFDRDDQIGAD